MKKRTKKETITADELSNLTGLTVRWLRKLAAAGRFPPPVRGVYEVGPTLSGYFTYLRERLSRKSDGLYQERIALMRAKREMLQLELEERRSGLVDRTELSTCLRNFYENQRAAMTRIFVQELATDLVKLNDIERRERIRSAVDEYFALVYECAKQWMESPPQP